MLSVDLELGVGEVFTIERDEERIWVHGASQAEDSGFAPPPPFDSAISAYEESPPPKTPSASEHDHLQDALQRTARCLAQAHLLRTDSDQWEAYQVDGVPYAVPAPVLRHLGAQREDLQARFDLLGVGYDHFKREYEALVRDHDERGGQLTDRNRLIDSLASSAAQYLTATQGVRVASPAWHESRAQLIELLPEVVRERFDLSQDHLESDADKENDQPW